jgi:hypothetical protein
MSAPKLAVAGHCTHNSAKLLAIFDPPLPADTLVHLHFEAAGRSDHSFVRCKAANPYSLALFELDNLPSGSAGVTLHYSIDTDPEKSDHTFHRTLRLLPEGRSLRFALVSCNGVYRIKDADRAYVLWRELRNQVEAGKVDFIVHAGDQIYADSIAMQQLADSDKIADSRMDEMISEYRKTYVNTWSAPEVAGVLSRCPSLMMWDDHDIFDGYGSHSDDSSAFAQSIFAAAKQAFWEFQAWKNPSRFGDHSFGFATQMGSDAAILVLDGRHNRMWTAGRILGEPQLQDVERWLTDVAHQKPKFLLVVTAIPFLHIPVMSYLKFLEMTGAPGGLVEDLRDSWTARNNLQEGIRVLSALFDFKNRSPNTRLILLSGDVHVATLGSIRAVATNQTMEQIVSSGIGSPPPYGIVRMMLRWASEEKVSLMNGAFHGELKRLRSPDDDFLLAKRNFVIVDLNEPARVEFFADYDGEVIRFEQPINERNTDRTAR